MRFAMLALVCLLTLTHTSLAQTWESGTSGSIFRSKASNQGKRVLQSNALRVYLEFVRSDSLYQPSNSNYQKYLYSKQAVIRASAYYSSFLKVRTWRDRNEFTAFVAADGYTQPGRNFQGDLFIYFNAQTFGTTWASYNFGAFDPVTFRCIAASFIGNLNMFNTSPLGSQKLYTFYRRDFYRILVFDTVLFNNFINPTTNVKLGLTATVATVTFNGVNRQGYVGGNALGFAKSYTGETSSMSYILLENDPTVSSTNWDQAYWPQELMIADDNTYPRIFSGLSAQVAVDSGWYEIDTSYIEVMYTGATTAGGNLQVAACPNTKLGFCSSSGNGLEACSVDQTSKARCITDSLSNNCYALKSQLDCGVSSTDYGMLVDTSYENIGKAGSRCGVFNVGTSRLARCAVLTCDTNSPNSAANPGIIYTFANSTTCTCNHGSYGNTVNCNNVPNGGVFQINCPTGSTYDFMCSTISGTRLQCPNDCSGRGTCGGASGSRKCSCNYGWMGSDCNTANPAEGSMTNPIGITTIDISANILKLSSIILVGLAGLYLL